MPLNRKLVKKNYLISVENVDNIKHIKKFTKIIEYLRKKKVKRKITIKFLFINHKTQKLKILKKHIIKEIARSYNSIYNLKIHLSFNERI